MSFAEVSSRAWISAWLSPTLDEGCMRTFSTRIVFIAVYSCLLAQSFTVHPYNLLVFRGIETRSFHTICLWLVH
jgi:hypothetical protein